MNSTRPRTPPSPFDDGPSSKRFKVDENETLRTCISHADISTTTTGPSETTDGEKGIGIESLGFQIGKGGRGFKDKDEDKKSLKKKGKKKYKKKKEIDPLVSKVLERVFGKELESGDGGGEGEEVQDLFERGSIVKGKVKDVMANGDGIIVIEEEGEGGNQDIVKKPQWIVFVPFVLPGEFVEFKIVRNEERYSHADLVKVLERNVELRGTVEEEKGRIKCKYFGTCGGCQYQMLSYQSQLLLKQRMVTNAFRDFCIPSTSSSSSSVVKFDIPSVLPTLPSPNQYEYRTKLTPHFQTPEKGGINLAIGFEEKGRRRILDIEECVIATPIINENLKSEKVKVIKNIEKYKRGATLLLRDSLPVKSTLGNGKGKEPILNGVYLQEEDIGLKHICVTDYNGIVREKVEKLNFEFTGGSFFQNNNSILPSVLKLIQDILKLPNSSSEPTYLIDAYCGSGFFSLSLAHLFTSCIGIEISSASVTYAKHNGTLNGISNVSFILGKAEEIFSSITFPHDKSVLVIDPPRKGCDSLFLDQVIKFLPKIILYVSCNVHTQARDVAYLLERNVGYRIESVRGMDFFPQTHHIEGLCVLRRDVNSIDD